MKNFYSIANVKLSSFLISIKEEKIAKNISYQKI